jgi:HK97 family phage portal protein
MNRFKQAWNFITAKSYEVLFYNDPDDGNTRRTWGKTDYLKANEISLYLNRAIAKRSEKVSEVDFFLTNRATGDVIEDHDLLTLLNKPNEFHTGLQFWGLYQKYRDLIGSAFIWKVPSSTVFKKDQPSELILLRPDFVSIQYSDGKIVGFKHSGPNNKTFVLPPEQVIYLYTPDPMNPTEGISLIKAGPMAIDTEVQLSKYHANVIRNGGNVGNVIKFKTPSLTKQQVAELKASYKDQYAGAKNSGEPMFLGGDAEVINLGLTPTELSYLETKRLTLDDICIMTGVPKAVLAVSSGETFANADASVNIFLRETIKPLLTDLKTILDWRLIPDEFDLEFTDPTPENIDQKLKETETGLKNSYMTINEARERHGLEPVPEGDQILVSFGLVPLAHAVEDKPDAAAANDNIPPGDQQKSKGGVHPLRDKFIRDRYGKVMVKRMDRHESRVLQAIKEYFSGQRRRIIEHVEGVRVFRRKDILDELFNHETEIRLAKGTLLPLIRDILKRSGTDAAEFAGAAYPFHLSSRIESFLDSRANIFANQITETTFEKLKREFRDSLDQDESRQQLVGRIRNTYNDIDDGRARTIARTEVHAATQTGTMEGYKQAGLDTKIWVAVMDDATRDSHAEVDGEEVPIDQYFSNGLRYPGDPSAAADEVINCRCSV